MATETRIEQAYRARTARSAELYTQALEVLPSGIAHDSRHLPPYGLYVERAEGPRKWDVDGNEYVDFFGGHGALLLGHNPPAVLKATEAALRRGTHFATSHAAEIAWARQVIDMMPSAQKVRFTSSGTEATLMCLRLARAHTGKRKLLRFRHNFHGWHDDMTTGYASHFDGSAPRGIPEGVAGNVVLVDNGDLEGMRAALAGDREIACAILEPLGAATGQLPVETAFLQALREATEKAGVLLIFDEVVTGFRVSPGGVQGATGVIPDLTSMAKIVAGGMPGGCVGGRTDILDQLDFAAAARSNAEKIYHPGTFNANPVSAAAGVAALRIIATTDACARAEATAAELRAGMNAALKAAGVSWAVYGRGTALHTFLNPAGRAVDPERFDPMAVPTAELKAKSAETVRLLRLAMMVNGVDISPWPGGLVSAAHGPREVAETVAAWGESLRMLKGDAVV
ncbi:MAG TPA: aminotransferase class III-fold pyridoxal phosphate-dependent enzyme [Thermohalobaculum sp.]|nr:aminotransferase class III-fold pyridoxal phosphate-dependent enzyme [Thermohalobaculum sp.]